MPNDSKKAPPEKTTSDGSPVPGMSLFAWSETLIKNVSEEMARRKAERAEARNQR